MNKAFVAAIGEYGVKGIVGASHNADILTYFRAPGFKWVKDDETAWCAAFVNWALWKVKLPGTNSLLARSFLKYGKRTLAPQLGCLVVFWRVAKDSPYGHVGFFIKETKDAVYVLGGNQSNAVNITAFPKEQVLEYRTIPNSGL
jgi:uncharacterized protein (TIGR02594 family)